MPGQWIVVASSEAWPEAGAQAERSFNTGWALDNGGGISSSGGMLTGAGPSTATAFLSTGDGTTGSGNGFYAVGRRARVVHAGGTAYGFVVSAAYSTSTLQTTVAMGGFADGGTTSLSTTSITSAAIALPLPLAYTGGTLYQQPYNYLTNPGFEVWQRGAGAFTALAAFTADRWQIFDLGSTGTLSVSRTASNVDTDSQYAAVCTSTSTGASAVKFAQKIADEDSSILRQLYGRPLTFAIRVRAGSTGWHVGYKTSTGTGAWDSTGTSHSGSTTYETLFTTFTLSTAATQLWVGVGTDTATTGTIDNANLVIGGLARYYPLQPAEDWGRCQRYYETWGLSAALMDIVQATAQSSGNWSAPTQYATRKAVTPTATKVGTFVVSNCAQPTIANPNLNASEPYVYVSAAGAFFAYTDTTDDGFIFEANP